MSEDTQEVVDPDDEISYWSIVWGQFKKNKVAYWGMWAIVGIVLLAIYAPVLALDYPFYITYADPTGGTVTEFPWFSRLLFDRNLFENTVDIFFNLVLALSPLMAVTGLVLWKVMGTRRRKIRMAFYQRAIWAWSGITLACLVTLMVLESSQPYNNYVEIQTGSQLEAEVEIIAMSFANDGKVDPVKAAELRSHVATSIFPLVPQSFRTSNLSEVESKISRKHLLGTDNRGRDVFARMVYGTRISLTIGAIAVSIYIVIGIILGAVGGYFRGWVDSLVLRMVEVMLCFPSFILILTLVAFIDKPSIFHVMIIIGLTRWTGPARLVRGEFLKLGGQDFVAAAIASGIPQSRVIFRHVLPNALSPVLVNATFGVASAILLESGLAFLGVGDPSAASWGEILNIGRQTSNMALILFPGLAIFATVSLFNLVGEGIRDALDPKMRK